jgi:hypothetical protein
MNADEKFGLFWQEGQDLEYINPPIMVERGRR